MRKEKLKKLGDKANKHLNIDYSRYEVDEAVATIADVLILPVYIGRALVIPIVGFFLLAVGVALLSWTNYFQLIVYPLTSWILILPFAIILGLILLQRRIRKDVATVFSVAVDTAGHVYEDTRAMRTKAQEEGAKASFYQVFKGVTYMVILPSMHKVLERKLPLMGGVIAHAVDRVFSRLIRTRKKDFDAVDSEAEAAENPDEALFRVQNRLSLIKENSGSGLSKAMRVLAFPLFLLAILAGGLSALVQMLWYNLFF